MHLYTLWGLDYILIDETKRKKYIESIKSNNFLFGSLNEPSLYFVTLDKISIDQYPIKSIETDKGYIINGIKKFVSLEPFIQYFPVYCLNINKNTNKKEIIVLIIDRNAEGISIEKDWNSNAMKNTHSNSVLFNNVFVSYENLICAPKDSLTQTKLFNYLFRLSICSVYFAMSEMSVNFILEIIKKKNIPHWNIKLKDLPGIQFSLAEVLMELQVMESQIKNYCEELKIFLNDFNFDKNSQKIESSSLTTKLFISRSAQSVVNKCMKIQGMASIAEDNLLSKLYRDIKAIEFHPPQEDITKELIAKSKLGIITLRKRWF